MALLEKNSCCLCGGDLFEWTRKKGETIFRCKECNHITVPGGGVVAGSGKSIYEAENSIFKQDGNEAYYLGESNLLSAGMKADIVAKYFPANGSLFDVGANYGHFLKVIGKTHPAQGLEISPAAVEWSKKNFDVDNYQGSVYDIPDNLSGPFDIITCWDTIEHLDDPVRALNSIKKCLSDEGILFLSTPDSGSVIARILGKYWYFLDPVQHINLFSRKNLVDLLEKNGFEVMDSTYIGHCYKIEYIFNRLHYLTEKLFFNPFFKIVNLFPRAVKELKITIKMRDVMVIVAKKNINHPQVPGQKIC